MKHSEVAEMARYLRDHLIVSHGWTKAEAYAIDLDLLGERHVEEHK